MIKKWLLHVFTLLLHLSMQVGIHASTPLRFNECMFAIMQGDVEVTRNMVRQKCYVEVVANNPEPLLFATFGGSTDIMQVLLDAGADINAASPNGLTPLIVASQLGNEDTVKFLLAAGAIIDKCTNQRETALMAAAMWGHVGIVRILLAAGASATIYDSKGRSARDYILIGQELLKDRTASPEDDVLILRLLDEPEQESI